MLKSIARYLTELGLVCFFFFILNAVISHLLFFDAFLIALFFWFLKALLRYEMSHSHYRVQFEVLHKMINISIMPQKFPCPFLFYLPPRPCCPPAPDSPALPSVTTDYFSLARISYKWIIACMPFCLASFTQHNCFKIDFFLFLVSLVRSFLCCAVLQLHRYNWFTLFHLLMFGLFLGLGAVISAVALKISVEVLGYNFHFPLSKYLEVEWLSHIKGAWFSS